MILFFSRKLGEFLLTLWILATLTFFLLKVLPGSPFDSELATSPEVMARLQAHYHLQDPWSTQYFVFLKGILVGDWGQSLYYLDRSVSDILREAAPVSLHLGIMALILSYATGIAGGLWASSQRGKWGEGSFQWLSTTAISIPSFVAGPGLILILALHWNIFPAAQWEGPRFWVLPVLTLSLRPAAVIGRLVRAKAIEFSQSDFVRSARAKGISEFNIYLRHILKNSLVGVFSLSGSMMANILSGSFVVEMMFNVPGLGRHFVQSVTNRDYPLVLALTLFFAMILMASNFVFDLLIMKLDPRVEIE